MSYYPHIKPLAEKARGLIEEYKLAYLVMETRTGKTPTALFTLAKLGVKNALFVTTKKAMSGVLKYHPRPEFPFKLTVINFDSVHKVEGKFDIIVIDEAHSVGMYPKKGTRIKKLLPLCKDLPILFLSATPSPESHSQLFHQFYLSSFGPWRRSINFYQWAREYVEITTFKMNGYQVRQYHKTKTEKVMNDVKHLYITFTQQQGGFRQVVNDVFHDIEMSNITYRLIKKLTEDRIINGKESQIIADTPAKLLQKHHQLSSGTIITEDGERRVIDDSKAQYIKTKFVEEMKIKTIAIFYKFTAEKIMIKSVFPTATDDHEAFQNGKSDIVLLQFRSGREGVDLSRAECLICFNVDHSFLSYEQTRNRLQSKDRETTANVHWLFNSSRYGIEEKIFNVVKKKTKFTTAHYKRIKFDEKKQLNLFEE